MKVELAYGKDGLAVDLPDRDGIEVLRMRPVPPLSEPERSIREALAAPTGTAPLLNLAHGKQSACVVISDITRPVPNHVILPPILEALQEGGVAKGLITILVATGIHRPSNREELVSMVGEEIAGEYPILNHHSKNKQEMTYLGDTSTGVPVHVNSAFLAAELRITTGLIEPHLLAGYSGGRKAICPGISSLETVKLLHGPDFVEDPRASGGKITHNPFHEAALEIARRAQVDFIVNVALDEDHRITGAFAGDLEDAHLAGVQFVEQQVRAEVAEPVDIVVTTSAGYPLDLTYYQAIKGLTAALPILKPGGTIILAAQCAQGVGGPEFTQLVLQTESPEGFTQKIREPGFFVVDQWMLEELCKVLEKARVFLYSDGIPAEHRDKLLVEPAPSVGAAIQQALAAHGPDARIAVIPQGPYVLPVVRDSAEAEGRSLAGNARKPARPCQQAGTCQSRGGMP